jgi:hypothetical protein
MLRALLYEHPVYYLGRREKRNIGVLSGRSFGAAAAVGAINRT